MRIVDRLYGILEFDESELRLFRTPQFIRLRQVSLSAVPTIALPTGTCASKFEHSIGAAHLGRILCKARPEFRPHERDIFCSSLVHDIASPPFTHLSEHFLRMLTGKSHEEFAADVLDNSELSREIRNYGSSTAVCLDYIKGEGGEVARLISGDIDIDNLDNTARYLRSLCLPGHNEYFYSPDSLVTAFTLHEGSLAIDATALEELDGWARCRQQTYNFTYGHLNLAPCSMIFRALDLAMREGELPISYFLMRDDEAYGYLEEECNRRTRTLMRRARHFETYEAAYAFSTKYADDALQNILRPPSTRISLADEISAILRREPEDVAVYAGLNRAFKTLRTPVIDSVSSCQIADNYLPRLEPIWLLNIYVHEPSERDRKLIEEYAEAFISRSQPAPC